MILLRELYVYQSINVVILFRFREMWQAERWNTDQAYMPVMIVHPDHIFLQDFVLFKHPVAGCTIGRIESFFVMTATFIPAKLIYAH